MPQVSNMAALSSASLNPCGVSSLHDVCALTLRCHTQVAKSRVPLTQHAAPAPPPRPVLWQPPRWIVQLPQTSFPSLPWKSWDSVSSSKSLLLFLYCGPSSSCLEVQTVGPLLSAVIPLTSPQGRQKNLLRGEMGSDPFLPDLRSHSCCFAFSLLTASAGGLVSLFLRLFFWGVSSCWLRSRVPPHSQTVCIIPGRLSPSPNYELHCGTLLCSSGPVFRHLVLTALECGRQCRPLPSRCQACWQTPYMPKGAPITEVFWPPCQ